MHSIFSKVCSRHITATRIQTTLNFYPLVQIIQYYKFNMPKEWGKLLSILKKQQVLVSKPYKCYITFCLSLRECFRSLLQFSRLKTNHAFNFLKEKNAWGVLVPSLRGCLHEGRKILEGETTFRLVYVQKFQLVLLPSGERKQDEIVGLKQLDAQY